MDRIVAAIAARRPLPDVLALQEVEDRSLRVGLRGHQLERFVDKLQRATDRAWTGYHWSAHRYGTRVPVYGQGQALVLGPDVELVRADEHDITHVRLPLFARLKQRRIAVHARLRSLTQGEVVDVTQAHLSLPAFFERGDPPPGTRRMGHGSNQVHEMRNLLRWLDDRGLGSRSVLFGDLNSRPGTRVTQMLEEAGWTDGFRHGADLSLDEQCAMGTHDFLGTAMHIDHLYLRAGLAFAPTELHRLGEGPFAGLSDHTPKEGRLVFP